jgi:AsmA protein
MKILKYVAIGAGVLVALLLIGVVLLFTLVNPNDYKGDIQALVQKQTGRTLKLQGDLKLSVWPSIALEFGPATLGNAPGFGAEPLLSVERVRLGVRLAPLLHKRIDVERAELSSPTVRLMVNESGADNWTGLTDSSAREKSAGAPGAAAGLSIAGVRISDGSLSYSDKKAGSTTSVEKWQLQTGPVDLDRPIKLQTSFTLHQGSGLGVAASIDTQALLDIDHDKYQLTQPVFDLVLSGASMPKGGLKARLSFATLQADLNAQTLNSTDMKLDSLGTTITGAINGRQIVDAPVFSGPIHLAEVAPAELLKQLAIGVPVTSDPKVLKRLELQGQLQASSSSVMLNQVKAQLDDSAITGSAGISDLARTALAFKIRISNLNLDRYLAPATPAPAAGAPAAKPSTAEPLPVDWLKELLLKGDVVIDAAVFSGIKLSKLHLGVDAHDSRLHLLPSEAQLYGGQYRGDITLDVNGAVPRLSFNEQVNGVEFAPLLKDWFKNDQFSGRGNLTIKAQAAGKDSDSILRALNGSFSIKVDNAAIEGKDLWYEIRRANSLLRKRAPPERAAGPVRTVFSALSSSGSIANGVFNTSDVQAETRGMKVAGGGSIDVPHSHLDMKLNVAIQKAADDTSPDAADINGFTVPVLIGGALTDPSVRPDVAGLAKAAVQKKVDEKKDELKQKLQDAVQDKLKNLFH